MNQKIAASIFGVSTALMANSSAPAPNTSRAALPNSSRKPNIVLIYADDFGYGDAGCYGASRVKTPNLDRLAAQGLRFDNAYATSATCTPSRYSLLTGEYAWRQTGTGIAPGDATALIRPGRVTLPSVLQKAGYQTAVVGKWHLGLGGAPGPAWNGEIKPGPLEIGFNYSFILPATADRVPCVYVENHRVVGLDPNDPLQVSYEEPIEGEPVAAEHPELLKMQSSHGHNQAIVNGIGRIGYMSGAKAARWVDEDIAEVLTGKAIDFIENNRQHPFFLYLATHDIHVPRVPHARFVGKSGLGPRGDAILQLDWTVGEVMKTLKRWKLDENTLLIFTSDNGPVLDDGYVDDAVQKLNGHRPAGPLRGGKYSAFEAGTRIPLIVRWPDKIKSGTSKALVSQIDLLASLAALTGQKLDDAAAPDSLNRLAVLLGQSQAGRDHVVEHAGALSLIRGDWKYIEPHNGPRLNRNVNIELGNDAQPQLYNLKEDVGEIHNVAALHPDKVAEMAKFLRDLKAKGRTR